jgi:hypothetical protein
VRAIERMAKAAWEFEAISASSREWAKLDKDSQAMIIGHMRGILLAIRDPDEETAAAGQGATENAADAWRAMIDHIRGPDRG